MTQLTFFCIITDTLCNPPSGLPPASLRRPRPRAPHSTTTNRPSASKKKLPSRPGRGKLSDVLTQDLWRDHVPLAQKGSLSATHDTAAADTSGDKSQRPRHPTQNHHHHHPQPIPPRPGPDDGGASSASPGPAAPAATSSSSYSTSRSSSSRSSFSTSELHDPRHPHPAGDHTTRRPLRPTILAALLPPVLFAWCGGLDSLRYKPTECALLDE